MIPMRRLFRYAFIALTALVLAGCGRETPDEGPRYAGKYVGMLENAYVVNRNDMKSDLINRIVTGLNLSGGEALIISPVLSSALDDVIPEDAELRISKIKYLTTNPAGDLVTASGVVACPSAVTKSGKFDRIVSVQHGTCDIGAAPTDLKFAPECAPVFHQGAKGMTDVVILADYLGYGVSRTPRFEHPYLHAGLTGTASADFLKAAEEYLEKQNLRYRDEKDNGIELCGYSQGGQGTLATLFELQRRGYTDRITRVRAGAGPVDLLGMLDNFKRNADVEYAFCGYLPYLIRGIIYGDNLDLDLRNIYAQEVFDSGMDKKFNSSVLSTWHIPLGKDIRKVIHPDFFKTEGANKDVQSLLAALERNSLFKCDAPAKPEILTLYHEVEDEQVPYICSLNASRQWGCELVDLTIVDNVHLIGAIEFFIRYCISETTYEKAKEKLEPLLNYLK